MEVDLRRPMLMQWPADFSANDAINAVALILIVVVLVVMFLGMAHGYTEHSVKREFEALNRRRREERQTEAIRHVAALKAGGWKVDSSSGAIDP